MSRLATLDLEKTEATINLHKAAPDLLAVCEELVNSEKDWGEEYFDMSLIVAKANAAIAKSGGTDLRTPNMVRPITDRAKEYHAWKDRLSADPTCWQFSDREEAIAYAAFIAGWWLRTGDNPDDHFNPPTNVTIFHRGVPVPDHAAYAVHGSYNNDAAAQPSKGIK